jgi:hypothetical protein
LRLREGVSVLNDELMGRTGADVVGNDRIDLPPAGEKQRQGFAAQESPRGS